MCLRLGAVTGVGHARLILERFGKFWGAFSVGDLFILNFLTLITEFIGVSLAMSYFGISPFISVPVAAVALIAVTITGSFRRWERFMYGFIVVNLVAIPLTLMVHPDIGIVVHDSVVPSVRGGLDGTALLLIISIVGTTVAPWQLFFQQSNVIDKRITPTLDQLRARRYHHRCLRGGHCRRGVDDCGGLRSGWHRSRRAIYRRWRRGGRAGSGDQSRSGRPVRALFAGCGDHRRGRGHAGHQLSRRPRAAGRAWPGDNWCARATRSAAQPGLARRLDHRPGLVAHATAARAAAARVVDRPQSRHAGAARLFGCRRTAAAGQG